MQSHGARRWTRVFHLSLVAIAALFALQRAHATEITYDSTNSVLPQFDASLGTLTGATYSVTGDLDFAIVNTWTQTIGVAASFSVGLTLNGTGLSYKDPNYGPDFTGVFNWGTNGLLAPGASIDHSVAVDLTRTVDLSLAPMIGTGTVSMVADRSEDSDTCMSDDLPPGQSPSCPSTRNLTDHVTYDYTPSDPPDPAPLPEPSSALLLGLPMIAFLRRRV